LTIPWCTYCSPEIAHIGMRLKEARELGMSVKSYTVMMQDVDRAITDGQDDGFVKIYVREGSDTIIGATIVAARASEMINEMSVIMSAGIGMRQLANIVHAYPARSGWQPWRMSTARQSPVIADGSRQERVARSWRDPHANAFENNAS